jgi:hypothetical protein
MKRIKTEREHQEHQRESVPPQLKRARDVLAMEQISYQLSEVIKKLLENLAQQFTATTPNDDVFYKQMVQAIYQQFTTEQTIETDQAQRPLAIDAAWLRQQHFKLIDSWYYFQSANKKIYANTRVIINPKGFLRLQELVGHIVRQVPKHTIGSIKIFEGVNLASCQRRDPIIVYCKDKAAALGLINTIYSYFIGSKETLQAQFGPTTLCSSNQLGLSWANNPKIYDASFSLVYSMIFVLACAHYDINFPRTTTTQQPESSSDWDTDIKRIEVFYRLFGITRECCYLLNLELETTVLKKFKPLRHAKAQQGAQKFKQLAAEVVAKLGPL